MAPDILIVAATLIGGLSVASVVAGWASRTRPAAGLFGLVVAAGLFGYAALQAGDLAWNDVPDSFILVAARILN